MAAFEDNIISGTEFNPNKDVKYTKPKVSPNGRKTVGILNAHSNSLLDINAPLMFTWGVNKNLNEQTGRIKYDLPLQFPNDDYPNEDATAFLEKMKQFEQKIRKDAIKNSKEWFGKDNMSEDVVDALMYPIVKYPKIKGTQDPDYSKPPHLRLQLNEWEGEWKFDLYNTEFECIYPNSEQPEDTPLTLIPDKAKISTLITCGGVFFIGGKFGVTWKLKQAIVQPRYQAPARGVCRIKPKAADIDEMKKQKVDDEDDDDEPQTVEEKAQTEDSDEEEEVAEPEPEPEPEPVKPKKKVVKKKVVKKKST